MNLYVDIGNSNIVIGKGNHELVETYRYKTDTNRSSDEYHTLLKHLFEEVERVIIASVVPELNALFKTFIQEYFHISPEFVGPGVKTGVKLKTDNPKEVGADLVAAAAGTLKKYGESAVIIDMGTATTFTALKVKEIIGVAITIGLDTSKQCLISQTSKLLQFEFEPPAQILGTNTVDALNSGMLFGHAFQVIGFAKNILKSYAMKEAPVIITGGAAKLIDALLPNDYIIDEHLVLEGLIAIAEKN